MSKDVELVALAVKGNAVSCRILGKGACPHAPSPGFWEVVPGEIITVSPGRKWRYGGHPYLAGEITASRIDIPALGLTPLETDRNGDVGPQGALLGRTRRADRAVGETDHQARPEARV